MFHTARVISDAWPHTHAHNPVIWQHAVMCMYLRHGGRAPACAGLCGTHAAAAAGAGSILHGVLRPDLRATCSTACRQCSCCKVCGALLLLARDRSRACNRRCVITPGTPMRHWFVHSKQQHMPHTHAHSWACAYSHAQNGTYSQRAECCTARGDGKRTRATTTHYYHTRTSAKKHMQRLPRESAVWWTKQRRRRRA